MDLKDLFGIPKNQSIKEFLKKLGRDVHSKVYIYALLRNPLLENEIENEIESIYNSPDYLLNKWVKGGFGFFLFTRAAERFALTKKEKDRKTASDYIKKEETQEFISDEYRIKQKYLNEYLEFHRAGTTSYILNLHDKFAIKIIKFQYIDNPVIIKATKTYEEKYEPLGVYSPKIHHSSNRYIIMEFIKGDTLREFIDENIHKENGIESLEKINLAKLIVVKLCEALKYFSEPERNINHFDLSPENVILNWDKNNNLKLFLIDFGFNYLLVERIGSTFAFTQAQTYIAPELQDDIKKGNILSDIYSLGIILLETLGNRKLDINGIPYQLDYVWSEFPDFANIIEEMIDKEQKNRLFRLERGPILYSYIQAEIESEFQIYEEVKSKLKTGFQVFLENLSLGLKGTLGALEKILEFLRKRKSLHKQNKLTLEDRRLLYWALAAEIFHTLIVFLFFLFLIDDLKVLKPLINLGKDFAFIFDSNLLKLLNEINISSLRQNLPGRFVAVSFSIVATRYYLYIFSSISAKKIDRKTERWMRFNSFCFSIPVLWAIIFRPEDWPFCSAIGVFFVAANNYYCCNTAKYAKDEIEKMFDLPKSTDTDRFLRDFGNWWSGMLWYGIALIIGGIIMVLKIAKDDWIYAIIVIIFVNHLILFRVACTKKANIVRGGLERLFAGLKRVKDKENLKLSP